MIEESGTVLAKGDGFADVETIRTSSCTSCRARHGCGHHAIAQVSSSNRMRMRAIDSLDVKVGQKVVVGIPEDTLLQASLWMYVIPLIGLIGGAVLPSLWGGSSHTSVMLCVVGFASGLWLAKKKSATEAENPDFYPQILRISPAQENEIPVTFVP